MDTRTENIIRIIRSATPAQVAEGAAWYPVAHGEASRIAAIYGIGTDTVAAIIAALSPRNRWARNVYDAECFVAAAFHGLPRRPKACTFHANAAKAWDIATGTPWSDILTGPKVRSFVANIVGDVYAVTVDVWAVRAATLGAADSVGKRKGEYDAYANAYRAAAATLGLTPHTAQAIAWVVTRDLCKGAKGKDARMARMAHLVTAE